MIVQEYAYKYTTKIERKTIINCKRAFNIPIVLLELYLAFTVFVFFYGPFTWNIPSNIKLFTYLAINYFGLWFGYNSIIKKYKKNFYYSKITNFSEWDFSKSLRILFKTSMIFNILNIIFRLYALRGGIGQVISTIFNPGAAYQQTKMLLSLQQSGMLSSEVTQYSSIFILTTILSGFDKFYLPIGFICWDQLKKNEKILFFISLGFTIIFSLGMGTQIGIGNLLFTCLPVILYKRFVIGKFITLAQIEKISLINKNIHKRNKKAIFLAILLVILLICVIVFYQSERAITRTNSLDLYNVLGTSGFFYVKDTWIDKLFNDKIAFGLKMMTMYISHGYAGLGLCLELPFKWTYGLGWSLALQQNLSKYLGVADIFSRSYLMRNQSTTGWPSLQWWSTIFPWLASDITFYGTVFFMFFVGFLIAILWSRTILYRNPISFVILGQLFILVFMIPANNQLFQTLDGLFSTLIISIVYVFSDSKNRHKQL